jgi:DNA-directed RNA polymerase specialized sigma24 family protein
LGGGSQPGFMRHACVSTPYAPWRPVSQPIDPAEQVALVARARRAGLLRAHRHRLRREDLEDCLSQAVLELLAGARRGQRFSNRTHIANALEQRFLSRVHDRRRAIGGRSPLQAALEGALPLCSAGEGGVEIADVRAEVHPLVAQRLQLRRVCEVAPRLTDDQRLVLVSQVALGMERAEFCERFEWSFEKYRKVAQRARARLRGLVEAELRDRSRKPEPPLPEPGPCERSCTLAAAPRESDVPLRRGSRNREIGTHL